MRTEDLAFVRKEDRRQWHLALVLEGKPRGTALCTAISRRPSWDDVRDVVPLDDPICQPCQRAAGWSPI